MGRRPNVWAFRGYRCTRWRDVNAADATNEIANFDLERLETLPFKHRNQGSRYRNHFFKPPIERFLMNQVGRDYDDVFSELTKHVPLKYREGVRLATYKMPSSFHPEATRWYIKEYFRREPEGFYVDLETRVLCYEQPIGRKIDQEIERAKPVYQPFSVTQFKVQRADFGQNFVFNQLLVYEDFNNEAVKMKHCIRGYWGQCVYLDNQTSIWSLSDGKDKVLTIQLRENKIVQVRGLSNRKATEQEQIVIAHWAKWIKVGIGEFAF